MLRIEVSEEGRAAMPPIDVADERFVIGSSPVARIRLPAAVARGEHVTIDRGTWRTAEGSGALAAGHTFEIGSYRVRVAPAPAGAQPTPPQRTESLARELLRDVLGAAGAPTLTVERGPHAGAKRALPPPESTYVIGRGDDAQWIFDDPDLSKRHLEIRRTWDGVRAVDLDSKNGTKLEARPLRDAELRDGMVLELGQLALRYNDPAERHLGEPVASGVASTPDGGPSAARGGASLLRSGRAGDRSGLGPVRTVTAGRGKLIFAVAIVVALAAVAGLIALVLR